MYLKTRKLRIDRREPAPLTQQTMYYFAMIAEELSYIFNANERVVLRSSLMKFVSKTAPCVNEPLDHIFFECPKLTSSLCAILPPFVPCPMNFKSLPRYVYSPFVNICANL